MQTLIDLSSVALSESAGESWIQIMKTGEWDHPQYGKIKITRENLQRFKENFDKRVRGTDIAVDVSHNPDGGAVAWFKELRVEDDKLMALVAWTEKGAELVRSGTYRYFSPEFMTQWKDPATGEVYKDVLFGGALTNRPFLKGMEPIEFSESGMGLVWYDPDNDGDDDSTADPEKNPDWMSDVKMGFTPWDKLTPEQQKQCMKAGITKEKADAARRAFLSTQKKEMAEGGDVTNAHKSPPKGKPQDKSQYADPDHYKYPIDEKHIRAAVSYYNQSGQKEAGGYSDEQWAEIGRRIAAAANKHIGPGHKYENGKITTPNNSPSASKKEMEEFKECMDPPGLKNINPDDGGSQPHDIDIDSEAGKFAHKGGAKKMSETIVTLDEWKAAQERIRMLEQENRRVKMEEKVRGWMFNEATKTGKIFPAQREKVMGLLMSMNEEQVHMFSEFVEGLPDAVDFGERGFSADFGKPDPEDELTRLTDTYVKQGMTIRDAAVRAFKELQEKGIKLDR